MAGSVNKAIILGNLGRDPEVRTFQNGGRVCSLSIATSETWKDKATGTRRERTEWHRVLVSSDALVQLCERYLKKGSKVYIEGQMETRKWQDKSGAERFTTEVTVRPFRGSITLLDSRNESDQDGGGRDDRGGGGARSGGGFDGPGAPLGGAAGAGYGEPEFDDDIPF